MTPVRSWKQLPNGGYAAEIDCGHAWEVHGEVRHLPVQVRCFVCQPYTDQERAAMGGVQSPTPAGG